MKRTCRPAWGTSLDAKNDTCPPWHSGLTGSNDTGGGEPRPLCAPHLQNRPLMLQVCLHDGLVTCLISSPALLHHLLHEEIYISCQNGSVFPERRIGSVAAQFGENAVIYPSFPSQRSPLLQ